MVTYPFLQRCSLRCGCIHHRRLILVVVEAVNNLNQTRESPFLTISSMVKGDALRYLYYTREALGSRDTSWTQQTHPCPSSSKSEAMTLVRAAIKAAFVPAALQGTKPMLTWGMSGYGLTNEQRSISMVWTMSVQYRLCEIRRCLLGQQIYSISSKLGSPNRANSAPIAL